MTLAQTGDQIQVQGQKATLRKSLKAQRAKLKTEVPALNWGPAQLEKTLSFIAELIPINSFFQQNIASYFPIQSELDLTGGSTEKWLFPSAQKDGTLLWFERGALSLENWVLTPFGTKERPLNQCYPLDNYNLPIIMMVPALAVDLQGYRMGYGGGFYDRLIEKYSNKIVSICCIYDDLIIAELPREKQDKPVDIIVSEKKILEITNRNQLLCKLRT